MLLEHGSWLAIMERRNSYLLAPSLISTLIWIYYKCMHKIGYRPIDFLSVTLEASFPFVFITFYNLFSLDSLN